MRLRDNIRPPERYESEIVYPSSRRRRTRNSLPKTNYIPFNPNLPPAAFPTLDHPRPAGGDRDQQSHSDICNLEGEGVGLDPDTSSDDLQQTPLKGIDNYAASNGPQNRLYARNMRILDRSSSTVHSPSETGDIVVGETAQCPQPLPEEPLPLDPGWKDLSHNLQTEIAENMLCSHTWAKLQVLLGLTSNDVEELSHHLTTRNKQIDAENTYLQEMQAKQLEALMRIDNSELKNHSVPSMLVFRKGSVRYRRMMKENCARDYLLCQARDLMVARKFLSRRGLHLSYAGDWSNDFAVVPSSDTTQSPERLKWKLDSNPAAGPKQPMPDVIEDRTSEVIPSSPPMEGRSTPNHRGSVLGNPPDLGISFQSSHHRSSSYTEFEDAAALDNHRRASTDRRLVSLKIGSENAAQLQAIEQPSWGQHRPTHFMTKTDVRPFQLTNTMDCSSDDTLLPSPSGRAGDVTRVFSAGSTVDMPVRRKIGQWSNDTYQPKPSSITPQPRQSFGDVLAEQSDDRQVNMVRGVQDITRKQTLGDFSCVQFPPSEFDVANPLTYAPSPPQSSQSRQPNDEQALLVSGGFVPNLAASIPTIDPPHRPLNPYYGVPSLNPNRRDEMAEIDLRPCHTLPDTVMSQLEDPTYENMVFNPTETENHQRSIVTNALPADQIYAVQSQLGRSLNETIGHQPMNTIQLSNWPKDSENHGPLQNPCLGNQVTCESMREFDEYPVRIRNSRLHNSLVQPEENLSLLSRFQSLDRVETPPSGTATAICNSDRQHVSHGDKTPFTGSPSSSPRTTQDYAISDDPDEGFIFQGTNPQHYVCSSANILHETQGLMPETMPSSRVGAPTFDLDHEFTVMETAQGMHDASDFSTRGIQNDTASGVRPPDTATAHSGNSAPERSIWFNDEVNHNAGSSLLANEPNGESRKGNGIEEPSTEPEVSIVAERVEVIISPSAGATKKVIPAKRAASVSLDEQPRRSERLNPPLERRVLRSRNNSARKT